MARPYPKRERIHLPDKEVQDWDWLAIKDKDGNVLAHTDATHKDDWIRLIYEGVEFVSAPNGEIFCTFKSLEAKYT